MVDLIEAVGAVESEQAWGALDSAFRRVVASQQLLALLRPAAQGKNLDRTLGRGRASERECGSGRALLQPRAGLVRGQSADSRPDPRRRRSGGRAGQRGHGAQRRRA